MSLPAEGRGSRDPLLPPPGRDLRKRNPANGPVDDHRDLQRCRRRHGTSRRGYRPATVFQVDHYTFTTISSPKTAGVGFAVTVDAYDASNGLLFRYGGTATRTGQAAAAADQSHVGHVCVRRVDGKRGGRRRGIFRG